MRPRNRLCAHFCASALLCLILSPEVFAESPLPDIKPIQSQPALPRDRSGTLDGRLTDWYSLPLVQAKVVVRNLATGVSETTITGKNGSYRLTGLPPGEYQLEAAVPELGRGRVDGIIISAGHATRVQAALVMELPKSSIPPASDARELDPLAPVVSTRISSEELASVPLPERDWQAIAATTPAANPSGRLGGDFAEQPSNEFENQLLGSRGDDSPSSSIDGLSSSSGFHLTTGRSQRGTLGESAVGELVARAGNSTPDAGHTPGGSIQLFTNHGGNQLHGQAFYLDRQSLWNARNPFTQWIQQTTPATATTTALFTPEAYTPGDTRQSFGIGAGSRIRRHKIFWFAALDGLLANDPAVATVRHAANFFAQPTDDELATLGERLELPAPAYYEEEIAAYSGFLQQMATLLGPVPRTENEFLGFGRLDLQATDRQHFSLEGGATNADAPGGVLSRSSETYGSHSFGDSQSSEQWAMVRAESFLTADLLNTFAVQYRREVVGSLPQQPSLFESALIANQSTQPPEIVADSKYGFILGQPAWLGGRHNPDERVLVAQEMLSWVHGPHLLKFGASFDHLQDSTDTLANQSGTYSYADIFNFASDTAAFAKYGFNGVDDPYESQHNCDATGRVHRAGATVLGLGYLPCYAWYTQRLGPTNWSVSTNNLAAFSTEQWQPAHQLTLSAGMRLEAEQLPPPVASVDNPTLPDTEKLPATAFNFGPRVGLAWSPFNGTVLRAGAGLYFGRIDNSVVLAALTQTGSPAGVLNYFFKPTDPGAPPFPYVFDSPPQFAVAPGAVSFAPHFRIQQIEQFAAGIEQELPGHWLLSANALLSLGRHLPISVDTNLTPPSQSTGEPATITYAVVDALQAGPIKSAQITVPFYTTRADTSYQQLASIQSRANSTYEAAMIRLSHQSRGGLNLRAHYLYAHAMDWNPNETSQVATNDVLDPSDFSLEYGTSNLDIRHSAGATVLYETPWKLRGWAGQLANAWSVAALGQFRTGLPYTMRTAGYIPGFYDSRDSLIEAVATGMNGSGGDNRVYGVGRNTFRYPATYTADARLGKRFYFARHTEFEILAESFNMLNHQNVTLVETTGYYIDRGTAKGGLPTLNFLTGLATGSTEFGKPLDINATNFFRPRQLQLGLRARF
jgi:hypothetical protein